MRRIIPAALFLCAGIRCFGDSLDLSAFEGPSGAPIYVIDGDFQKSFNTNGVSVNLDWSSSMNPATGALTGSGDFTIQGVISSLSIDWAGSIGADMVVKSAGSVVRVNGKLNMNGSGTVSGYSLDRLSMIYTFSNFDVDAVAGKMSGYVSLKGTIKALGRTAPISLPKTYFSLDLPDVDSNGQWDSTGDWRLSDISATVDGKGKITGTGDFAVLDDAGDPYDVIGQKITGTVKGGIVSLTATGNSKATSKIKVGLTYRQSNNETVANKSSVCAYGQSRKF